MTDAIVVTAEFRLKPGYVDEWLRLMLDHYGPACVEEQGMLRYLAAPRCRGRSPHPALRAVGRPRWLRRQPAGCMAWGLPRRHRAAGTGHESWPSTGESRQSGSRWMTTVFHCRCAT